MKIKYSTNDTHTLSVAEVLSIFQTNAETGLSDSEAKKRSNEFGLNIYTAQKQKSIWLILLEQFKSPIVYLLVFGAAVSLYFRDYIEAIAILVVILVNALIGFLMEMQARSSMNGVHQKVWGKHFLFQESLFKITY
ncbi:cation-transporting P-type ATPase [Emticicia sp.]|uniref:cation-transporting P-type ATPase n=1 Tax=Emticicia sp. TaxID=1930953 RepID=UPI0037522EC4